MDWLGGIRVKKIPADNVAIDHRELVARLGGDVGEIPTIVYKGLLNSSNCCYSGLLCSVSVDVGRVKIGEEEVCSYDLARALDGCNQVLLLAATLGFSVDRYISGLGAHSVSEQFCADALADALIEGVCDYVMAEASLAGLAIVNRFSPGYGDLDLSVGPLIVSMLGADRSLGIRYTESGLALPKKTVTAFIGVRFSKE